LTLVCHPEEAESHAKRATPNEGPMQLTSSSTADATLILILILT
jgi:hypothetical protein